MKQEEKLLKVYEQLFNPINNKDFGLYWLVSNNKEKPLANSSELLKYVEKEVPEGSFINRYANLESDLVLENSIYLDFDLTKKEYLKQEETNTLKVLEELASNVPEKDSLKEVEQKYNKAYSVENGFIKGFNSFIDSLGVTEAKDLAKLVEGKEKEEIKGKSEKDVQKYYINKFEQDYLKEPFKEATAVAKYFESIGVKTVLNWSSGKGLHLRIPITAIDFKGTELEENPVNVKLFLKALAELIETKILGRSIGTSSLDYNVFCKGMQRIPCSKHNKTKLYANFINPSVKYLEAIDYLEAKVPVYLPELINLEENTGKLIASEIYKTAIAKAVEDSTIKTYDSEVGNIAYKFSSEDHKELKENILKIYPESLNFFPYKVIHLLKRTGFNKEEVEAIFHDVEPNIKEYNKNIKGNIKYAFENPNAKICGLRNLIEWIKETYPNNEKASVIEFFTTNFKYFDKPEETVLEDLLTFEDQDYKIIKAATKTKTYYTITDFIAAGYVLEVNKTKHYVYFKKGNRILAKLELRKETGVKAKSKDKVKVFSERITKKTGLEIDVPELIEELDNILEDLEEQEQEEEQAEEVVKETKTSTPTYINFHFKEYLQNRTGIYYIKNNLNGTDLIDVAKCYIKQLEKILDPLGVLEPVYNISFYNIPDKRTESYTYLTSKELVEKLKQAKVFYNNEDIEPVLNAFLIDGATAELVPVKEVAYLEGFFIVNGTVIENTKLKNLKYTSEDVYSAISLLNEIMEDRTEEGKANDSTVYRFMLWNPFSYCLKQLGLKTGLYSLILIGISKGNKTGAIKVGNLFYMNTEEETSGSTVSVLGSKLEENSFSKVFDECYNLINLPEAPDVMKKAVQDKTTRITKNRTDNKKQDKFNAFGLPVFLLNERMEFKDFIRERFKITEYTSKSYVPKEDRTKFNEKYLPETEDSDLKIFKVIGAEFKKKIVPLIEAKDKRLLKPEELTIEILKEIAEETATAVGKAIDFLPEMYNITEASTNYNYDVRTAIVKLLNDSFKAKNKVSGNNYSANDFLKSAINNDFDFITYNKNRSSENAEDVYLIAYSKFERYVNNNVEETVELETILEALDLTETLEAKRTAYNKIAKANGNKEYKTLSEFIRKQNFIKVEGSSKPKNIKGFYLTTEELINNLFSFNIDFSKPKEPVELKIEKATEKI